jgi:predicted ATPase/DNA-binding winged helix-turn-helix (wHTH) protein
VRAPATLAFGPFRLDAPGRRLTEAGRPVTVGDRALELLIALIERPGEVVSKSELMSRIWPDTHVEEANLRVQVAALRRALGGDGDAYVANAPGRGYRFVASVGSEPAGGEPLGRAQPWLSLSEPVGRETEIAAVIGRLHETRLLTIVGPGGIGKTTLATACARALQAGNADGVAFTEVSGAVDLTMTIAASLGLRLPDDDGLAALCRYLAPLELLLVLDSCEYAVDAVAGAAEAILRQAPGVTIVATSREPLRAESEVVWRIEPLATPPLDQGLSAAEALDYAAVRLFVDRASASDRSFRLTDDIVATIANICRRLDGLPLAIELAAGRIGAFGLSGIEAGLDNRFQILSEGRRTAMPRHRTMAAAIDWSYFALSADEQQALRRFSLFQAPFDAAAAAHLALGEDASPGSAIEVLSSLVAKSLLIADTTVAPAEYRLLDTTRDYARSKLEADEARAVAARHAARAIRILESADAELDTRSMRDWVDYFLRQLEDVRAALDWAFSAEGDRSFAVRLTIAAVPVWSRLNWIEERRRRIEAALAIVKPDSADEMVLSSALANALQDLPLNVPQAEEPCLRAISLARLLQDTQAELRSQWTLWSIHINGGRIAAAQEDIARYGDLVRDHGGEFERVIADRMIGVTELVAGNLASARSAVERVLEASAIPDERRKKLNWYAYDPDLLTRNMLVSLLWLEGKPDTAMSVAEQNLVLALANGNEATTCAVLTDAVCPVAYGLGDFDKAERYLARLEGYVLRGAASVYRNWGPIFSATLAAARGDLRAGLALVDRGLPRDAAHPRYTTTLTELALLLGKGGREQEGRRLANDLLRLFEDRGERWIWSEIQRVRGELCSDPQAAEALFRSAIKTARAQGARVWALRAATSLACLRPHTARDVLAPMVDAFTEGFQSKDLIAARAAIPASEATATI